MREHLGDPTSITVDGSHSWMLADPDAFGEIITNVIAAIPDHDEVDAA